MSASSSSASSENGDENNNWDEWQEEADDEEEQPTRCLFCAFSARGVNKIVEHCSGEHAFDIRATIRDLGICDEYGVVRLVNFIRLEVAHSRCMHCKSSFENNDALLAHMKESSHFSLSQRDFLTNDDYLRPVDPQDPLLFSLFDESEAMVAPAAAENEAMKALLLENQALKEHLAQMQVLIEQAKIWKTEDSEEACAPSSADQSAPVENPDKGYFESYSGFGIHFEMLSDKTRTDAYRDFLTRNPSMIQDKIVLDIGCGTGILSLFAAQSGAKQVIGLDMANIINYAQQIVEENGFSEKITLIKGKVESISLPVHKVDLIVSEWMGYFLLYESMLDTVIFARDHWLSENGSVQPSSATMFLCAVNDSARVDFWDNVYGYNMSAIKREIYRSGINEPNVDEVNADGILTDSAVIKKIDIATVKVEDCNFETDFELHVLTAGMCQAIVGYFDVAFEGCENPVVLSTSPRTPVTHWKQTIFFLKDPVLVENGWKIRGRISVCRNTSYGRYLDIQLEHYVVDSIGVMQRCAVSQHYELH